MNHMKEHWSEEMVAIRNVVTSGEEKVLSKHVLEMLDKRGMDIIDLALVIHSGEIILGLDENEECLEAYVKNSPGMHRLVLGKNSKQEDVVVAIEVAYVGNELVVEKIITIYSLDEKLEDTDRRKKRKLQIRDFLKQLVDVNHELNDDKFKDAQGRRIYFFEDGSPYVIGKGGRILSKFKGYEKWKSLGIRKSS